MLQKIDKFAPFAVVLIFLYLTYNSTTDKGNDAFGKKNLPKITKRMLNPEFLTPTTRSSPADRDPFEVPWASYISGTGVYGATTKPSEVTTAPTTKPIKTSPSTQPTSSKPPPLPRRPDAIFIGENFSMVVIGEKIYKKGSLIGGKDPRRCWLLEEIQRDGITIRFGKIRRVLKISFDKTSLDEASTTNKTNSSSSSKLIVKEARE